MITNVKVSMYRCSEMNAQRASGERESPERERRGMTVRRGYRKITHHITTQLQPVCGGAYGSSPFPTGPQTDGTFGGYEAMRGRKIGSTTHQMVFCRFAVADQAVRRVVSREEGKGRE